jgi:hypothetical protein
MGRKTRDRSGEVLKIPSGRTGSIGVDALGVARGLMLAPRLLALVDLLFQPSLDGLPTVPHVTAHPIADWAVALVPPAVQGVNRNAEHFRDIRKRHQLVTGLECHDHLPFVDGSQRAFSARRVSVATWAQSPDRSAGCGLATVKDLSREATVGGRKSARIEVARSPWKRPERVFDWAISLGPVPAAPMGTSANAVHPVVIEDETIAHEPADGMNISLLDHDLALAFSRL